MSACKNCPGPNVVHQHMHAGGVVALERAIDATRNPQTEEQLPSGDGAPASDGPVRHHANADPSNSAAPQPRVTHRF